ncbi:MAG: hypothetical protein V3V00_09330 [Saprospiraceae bacterium]
MNTYVVSNKQRNLLLSGIVLGIACLVWVYMIDDAFHTRFWSNFLHNSVFFTGVSFMAVFFYSICITAWAGWSSMFKRVWEAFGMFLIVGIGLIFIVFLGVKFGWHNLYHWADTESVVNDKILSGKSGFLNTTWYFISAVVVPGIWFFFIWKMRSLSIKEDTNGDPDFKIHHRLRVWAAAFLPLAGFTLTLVIWQWVMSIDAHWYSTLFAWYCGASFFVTMIAMTILVLVYLKGQGYYENVSTEHIHDLGKFLFGFSIFWAYLWFSQYMLIWYANIGEETVYFQERHLNYPVLFWSNLAMNFILPFFILMRNDTKRKFGSLSFVALLVIFGHWIDFFLMIKPGALHTAHEMGGGNHGNSHESVGEHGHELGGHAVEHASNFVSGFTLPGLLEIGTFIGFLCLFLYVISTVLSKSRLVPTNDPYISESLNHHV